MTDAELNDVLNTFHLPDSRRDIGKAGNVRWLLRNVSIENRHRVELLDVLDALKAIDMQERAR